MTKRSTARRVTRARFYAPTIAAPVTLGSMARPTPATDGLAMPAEWAHHEHCVIAWPCRTSLWRTELAAAEIAYAATARAIARFEHVLIVAAPGSGKAAAAACAIDTGTDIDVVEWAIDDSWTRDSGAIVVVDGERRAGVQFLFNAWGGKFTPYADDALFASRMCDHLAMDRYDATPFVLEGGAVTVDGAGTVITTEETQLNPNRNPTMTRVDIEYQLREWLGAVRVVWLPFGLVEDHDTDGHVDNVAAFVAPGTVAAQTTADRANPNFERLRRNVAVLRAAGLEVIEIDVLPYTTVANEPVVVPPTNFYQANGAVIVPVVDGPDAERALDAVQRAVRQSEVVGVPGATLAFGGGGVHCITQQVPATGTR
jgi:agmatine deiminase